MTPACDVTGGTPQQRVAVRRAVEDALTALDWDVTLPVVIEHRPDRPQGVEASAGDSGIWISTALAKGREQRIRWIASEEVAHCYLANRTGVPHAGTFIEVLIHELFGTWAQYRDHVLTGRIGPEQLTTVPVPDFPPAEAKDLDPRLGYQLGKHIAATALGSEANRRHLETWLNDPDTAPGLANIVRGLLDLLPWGASAAEMADELGEFYRGLTGGDAEEGVG